MNDTIAYPGILLLQNQGESYVYLHKEQCFITDSFFFYRYITFNFCSRNLTID